VGLLADLDGNEDKDSIARTKYLIPLLNNRPVLLQRHFYLNPTSYLELKPTVKELHRLQNLLKVSDHSSVPFLA
jgi:hypothetical protein